MSFARRFLLQAIASRAVSFYAKATPMTTKQLTELIERRFEDVAWKLDRIITALDLKPETTPAQKRCIDAIGKVFGPVRSLESREIYAASLLNFGGRDVMWRELHDLANGRSLDPKTIGEL